MKKLIVTKKGKGFTLVELLVVIAIIALLMSILMPALRKVKIQANTVVCQVQLKQWGTIMGLYAADHDGSFPTGWEQGKHFVNTYVVAMKKYYVDEALLLCPQATKTEFITTGNGTHEYGPGRKYHAKFRAWGQVWWSDAEAYGLTGSYCYNAFIANPVTLWGNFTEGYFFRNIAVKNAGVIPIMTDGLYHASTVIETHDPPPYEEFIVHDEDVSGYQRHCIDRHFNGTVNSLFMDTSVRPVGLKELFKIKWHGEYNIKNAGPLTSSDWPVWMSKFENFTFN